MEPDVFELEDKAAQNDYDNEPVELPDYDTDEEPKADKDDVSSSGNLVTLDNAKINEAFRVLQTGVKGTSAYEAAQKTLLDAFEQYVISIAWKHFPTFMTSNNASDIIQSGWEGFWYNVPKFDPDNEKKARASTFMYNHVKHAMFLFINKFIMGHSSERVRTSERKVRDAQMRLKEAGNANPQIVELAAEAGLPVAETHKALEGIGRRAASMSLQDERLYTEPADPRQSSPHKIVERREAASVLAGAVKSLKDPNMRTVILHKWGILGFTKMSDSQIHKATGISTEQIPKLEAAALAQLRQCRDLHDYYFTKTRYDEIQRTLGGAEITVVQDAAGIAMMDEIVSSFTKSMSTSSVPIDV